jgi:hypothetical protein
MSGIELLMCLCLVLLVGSLYIGMVKTKEISVFIEVNTLSSPYYNLGIFYEYKELADETRVDQLTIGLFFINLNVWFIKDIEA